MNEDQIQKYKSKLAADFSTLNIKSIQLIGVGWHHVALEVNDTIIFRLPREVHVKDLSSTVHYETGILRRLQNKLSITIPDPQYIAPDKSYFGYPKLNGIILEKAAANFEKDDWEHLLEDWITAASTIHTAITVDEARRLGVPDFDGFDTSAAEKILLLKGIDQKILDFAQATIQQVKSLDKIKLQERFIHNDLQFHNLLVDPDSKRISGIIDWTDVCIAPLAREFATSELMQRNLLHQATGLYEQRTGIHVDIAQAIMWRAVEELSDYVEELESGEVKEAAETLARINQLIL